MSSSAQRPGNHRCTESPESEENVVNRHCNITPAFEEILDCVGSRGKFQTRLNIVFNCFGPCLNLMSVNIFYLAMQTPDHWCHVPGRELTNLSLEEWKNFTIPREGDSFSKCLMYNLSGASNFSDAEPVKCQHGWDYDTTWFSLTAPSQMNWVCDNQQAVSDVLSYAQIIGVVLGLVFGYIGDMWGRRPQQLACLSSHVVSRLLLVLSPGVLPLFILAESLVSAAAGPMYESALSVGLELTDIRHRATVNQYASNSMGAGIMLAALVAWALGSWTHFLSCAALCCLALLLFSRWFPESPRWLACRGRDLEALQLLCRIAAANGTQVPPFAAQVMRTIGKAKADRRGFLSLFSSWNVFKNTVLLIVARSVQLLTLYSQVIMAGGAGASPFLSVAAQGAAQLPAYWAVHWCAHVHRLGRRWSAVASALLAAAASAAVCGFTAADIGGWPVTAGVVALTLGATAAQAMANLQSAEVHPTCLRQIAASVEWGVAGVVMSALPYLALLEDRRKPYAILAALNLCAALAVSFLPESAHQRLPETLQDAAVFGREQPYWSWRPGPRPAWKPVPRPECDTSCGSSYQ